MRRWLGPLAATMVCAAAVHAATLYFAPSAIMDRAMTALADKGVALHAFTSPQRVTPQTQAVVRSSPDLYYALCRYDLRYEGSTLVVGIGAWPGYQSLSFFDARTNNFTTVRASGQTRKVRLFQPGTVLQGRANKPKDELWIVSPSTRGVVLVRRLAPTIVLFEAAKTAGQADICKISIP